MYRKVISNPYRGMLRKSYKPFSRELFAPQLQYTQCRCKVTTSTAKKRMGFLVDSKPTVRELRQAYYEAAKLCHPDVKQDDNKLDFRELTEAYDHLMNGGHVSHDKYEDISRDEEDEYRKACIQILGIRAEIVEESKQNPMFLRWLGGVSFNLLWNIV